MAGSIEIDVWQGDIAELEVDAIVVAANESLFMTAGPAASLKRRGGDAIERAAVEQGPVEPGTAVATHGGGLAATYVIHAVGVGHERLPNRDQLASAIRSALELAAPLQLRHVATSLIGVEHGTFDPTDAAEVLVGELMRASAEGNGPETIVIVTVGSVETAAANDALARRRARVA